MFRRWNIFDRIIFFFFPRIIESSLIYRITETRANISNNDSQRSQFVGKLIDRQSRLFGSNRYWRRATELSSIRVRTFQFPAADNANDARERERERRSIIKIESRREKVRSQKLDKKFLFISLEIICNDEIVKSSCSVYRDSRYRVIE